MPNLLDAEQSVSVETLNDHEDEVDQNNGCYSKEGKRHDIDPQRVVPRRILAAQQYDHIDQGAIPDQAGDSFSQVIVDFDGHYLVSAYKIRVDNRMWRKM